MCFHTCRHSSSSELTWWYTESLGWQTGTAAIPHLERKVICFTCGSQQQKSWPCIAVYLSWSSLNNKNPKKPQATVILERTAYCMHSQIEERVHISVNNPRLPSFETTGWDEVLSLSFNMSHRGEQRAKTQPFTVFNNPSSSILKTCTYLPLSATTYCCTVTITVKAHLPVHRELLEILGASSHFFHGNKFDLSINLCWIFGSLQLFSCRTVKIMLKLPDFTF